mgnify:CR=1 FL=1
MSDLDDEELEATRRLNGVAKKSNIERTDINVGNIEKDIKRCEQLIKPEHANWIGISNQLAIAHVVERIKELEAKLEFKNWGDLDNTQFEEYMNQFIPKQKVKEIIYTIIDYKIPRTTNNGYYYDYFIKQEYKNDFVKLFNKLLEDK